MISATLRMMWNGSLTGGTTTRGSGPPWRSRIWIHSPISASGFGKVRKV